MNSPDREELCGLLDGRTIAFTLCGDKDSAKLLLAFHGALGVGDFFAFDQTFTRHGYLVVAPTLPGWGNSTPSPREIWVADYWKDARFLIRHLEHVLQRRLPLIDVMGVSYGSLAALNVAGQSGVDEFPRVRHCLITSGFVPFRMPGLDYSIGMPFQQRLTMGAFARINPWFAMFTGSIVGYYMRDVETATKFAENNLMGQLNAVEKDQLEQIRRRNPDDPRCKIASMGRTLFLSMHACTKGYTTIPQNLWDKDLWSLPPLPTFPVPLYITGATEDSFAPINLQRFLASAAPQSTTRFVEHPGGHMSYSLLFDDLFLPFAEWDGKA